MKHATDEAKTYFAKEGKEELAKIVECAKTAKQKIEEKAAKGSTRQASCRSRCCCSNLQHSTDLSVYLARYEANDWGILEEEDCHSNNMEMFALAGMSLKYRLPTGKFIHIETEWNEEQRHTIVCFIGER